MNQQPLSPIGNSLPSMWQAKPIHPSQRPPSSVLLQQNEPIAPAPRMDAIPPQENPQLAPYMQSGDSKQFMRMSIDSSQWNPLTMNDPMMSNSILLLRQTEAASNLANLAHTGDGRPSLNFRDETISSDMVSLSLFPRNSSYGDMSYMLPFQNRLLRRPSASSDMNWPVFSRRMDVNEEPPAYGLTEETEAREKQGGALPNGDASASSALSGLKRDHPEGRSEEESKSCDRISLMASIAKQELSHHD